MKKIFGLLLSIALISNLMMGIAFASEKITSEDLRQISASEIPDGVIPMQFKTESDALAYLNEVFSISNTVKEPANALARSTNGNATVDSERIGVLGGTVTLKLRYGTSGNGNTGTITYTDPYTVTSGFNMGLRGQKIHWELRLCVMEKMYFVMLTVLLVHILTWKVEQQNFMSAK